MLNSNHYLDLICLVNFQKQTVTPAVMDGETVIEPAVEQIVINTPFTRYSEKVFSNGVEVTNYSDRLDLDGQEAIIFCSCIHEHPSPGFLPSERDTAFNWENTIATSWDEAKDEFKVREHYGQLDESGELIKPGGWF